MGYDIYLEWDGMSPEEHQAQITGYDIAKGYVGYLRVTYNNTEHWDLFKSIYGDTEKLAEVWKFAFDFIGKEEILEKNINIYTKRFNKDHIPPYELVWLQSFREFYYLGTKKQREGLHPLIDVH